MSASTLFFSLVGGVLPVLLWLWFWLREDRLHPEPRSLIMLSFFWGMLMVLFALPVEQWIWGMTPVMTYVIIGWAVTEEVFKYIASYFGALRARGKRRTYRQSYLSHYRGTRLFGPRKRAVSRGSRLKRVDLLKVSTLAYSGLSEHRSSTSFLREH